MTLALTRPDLLCAWSGGSLLIVDPRGGCKHPLAGYYYREARALCDLELRVNREQVWACEAASPEPRRLEFSYVYPEITTYGGGGSGQSGDDQPRDARDLPQRGLLVNVEYRVRPASLIITTRITNVSRETLACELQWSMRADFADIQEVQGRSRQQRASVLRAERDSELTLVYDHPQLRLQSRIEFDPARRWRFSSGAAETSVTLSPREATTMTIRVHPDGSKSE